MRPVFGEQQRAGNDQKSNQYYPGLGFRGHALSRLFLMSKMILHRHWTTPLFFNGKIKPIAV
jgi:hypothetical protein